LRGPTLLESVEILKRDIAIASAKRSFGLEHVGVDQTFDDDLRVCRDFQLDGINAFLVFSVIDQRFWSRGKEWVARGYGLDMIY
jgi:hypothetical protein